MISGPVLKFSSDKLLGALTEKALGHTWALQSQYILIIKASLGGCRLIPLIMHEFSRIFVNLHQLHHYAAPLTSMQLKS